MSQTIKEKLREIISEVAEVDEVPDTAAFADLGIDSMMAIEIVAEVEREYKLSIPEAELASLTDLMQVYHNVVQKLSADAAE